MKRITATISYEFKFNPEDFGLEENCSEKIFTTAVEGYLTRIYNELEPFVGSPDEIEIDVCDI